MRAFLFILFALFVWSGAALAQSYPQFQNTTVNDFADLLNEAEEAALSAQLAELRQDTEIEMTVLTLRRQSDFAPGQTLESFATGLFDHWGIGSDEYDDGVLVMILRDDRAMRIELGAGFAQDWDQVAQQVIDEHFLTAFDNGDYPRGILQGSTAVIEDIIYPYLDGETPSGQSLMTMIPFALFAAFAALSTLYGIRRRIGDFFLRFHACPNCRQRGLRHSRFERIPATTSYPGTGIRNIRCPHCDFEQETSYVIAQLPRPRGQSGGGFGGGSSGGGGASGRW